MVIADGFSSARLRYGESAAGDGLNSKNIEKTPAQELPVHALSPGLHLRQGGINAVHVQMLIDASGHSELPPILVRKDGWRVIDGLHRLEAAKLRGDHSIKARFVDCTDAEALVLAMKANSSHGLPLSKTDRVSGAERVLSAHPEWSDRALASVTGLSAKTIASLRDRSAGGTPSGGKRLGRDGKLRSVTAGEGRRRAAEYINAHPNATLREVARETGVSLGTVHDVSARLRRGISPERNGLRGPGARLAVHPADRVADAAPVAGRVDAPDTDGTPLRCGNPTGVPSAWEVVAAKVANDPCIRYTEGGKEFLQWMALHATDPGGWQELVNAIPTHWLSVIAPIAESVSKEWSLFAERLRSRQEAV
ncbi:ParB/RepB/Spo0J family partition protein [Streptomyces sp. KMM 9044]|uniref:ParB/RepB/Spo0J family partition protein n=1 Tax=Streptomyces sp. KMM 9044 TaxID=2744474 RepID=UPI002150BE2B|nr:ParB N-terminal domain-containing protein [Streptomyces sp. KMM 9044]WAX76369.1 ParB N-terminal domain-containing protein [Streptomyces sp. KMM 9044]